MVSRDLPRLNSFYLASQVRLKSFIEYFLQEMPEIRALDRFESGHEVHWIPEVAMRAARQL